jgi:hypothetical protein
MCQVDTRPMNEDNRENGFKAHLVVIVNVKNKFYLEEALKFLCEVLRMNLISIQLLSLSQTSRAYLSCSFFVRSHLKEKYCKHEINDQD